jgi:hypothetical protein
MKYDHAKALDREAARAWCEEHQCEIDACGLTIDEAVDALLAGDLYRVDTGSAGYDMVVDAFNALDAIAIVADHAGIKKSAEELRTKFDPWTAQQVRL